jgi:epoxyqueuosine reductase
VLSAAEVKAEAERLGFVACGIARAEPDSAARFVFEERIDLGWYDGLPWFTRDRAARAADPRTALANAASVISLAAPYKTSFHAGADSDLGLRGRIARYAWGRDYHRVLEKKLQALARFVADRSGARSRGLVDYGPLAERAFAARAGIGWFGKHTNLLLPGVGSWVLLAELVTTAELEPDAPLAKSCGSCTRCAAACPTGAIVGERAVDNGRCISFQTIENRGPIPRELRPLMGDWIFGCDICQDVCPVGGSGAAVALPEYAPASLDAALPELTTLLALSDEAFRARFQGRALMRAKRDGLVRNACVALGNLGDQRAAPGLSATLRHDASALVRGHAAWALGRIGGTEADCALAEAAKTEDDEFVRNEIAYALSGAIPPADGTAVAARRRDWLAGSWRGDRAPDASGRP